MLGQYYKTWDGVQLDFTGAINIHTVGSKERMIGNYMFETLPESSGAVVVGFENHSGKTTWVKAYHHSAKCSKATATTEKTKPKEPATKMSSEPIRTAPFYQRTRYSVILYYKLP